MKISIVIDSFESKVIKVKVSKKVDKLNENLLDDKDTEKESSIWESIASKFSGTGSDLENAKDEENVLSIPMHPYLSEVHQQYIVNKLNEIILTLNK